MPERRWGKPSEEAEQMKRRTKERNECLREHIISSRPMAGDLLCVTRTDDVLIKEGSCGVVEGEVGKYQDEYSVLFNPSPLPWWYEGIVSSSGGPERVIRSRDMIPTGEKRQQAFHYFPHGIMGAGLAKTRTHEVNVFSVDLKAITKTRADQLLEEREHLGREDRRREEEVRKPRQFYR